MTRQANSGHLAPRLYRQFGPRRCRRVGWHLARRRPLDRGAPVVDSRGDEIGRVARNGHPDVVGSAIFCQHVEPWLSGLDLRRVILSLSHANL